MTLILCVDDRNGMMFGGRRQSKDAAVIGRILAATDNRRLLVSRYTAALFDDQAVLTVDDNYAEVCKADDRVFAENGPLPIDKADTLILYRWHRHYPADRHFEHNPIEEGFRFVSKEDFVGTSHDCITEEIYKR